MHLYSKFTILLILLIKVLNLLFLIRYNRSLSRFPISRAHLTVFIRVLERLHEPYRLLDRPADRRVINLNRPDAALAIDNVETSQGRSVQVVHGVLN